MFANESPEENLAMRWVAGAGGAPQLACLSRIQHTAVGSSCSAVRATKPAVTNEGSAPRRAEHPPRCVHKLGAFVAHEVISTNKASRTRCAMPS